MNAKERFYSGLAKETIGKITSNTDNWTSFLRTMSRNYEFTYPEQVMIYAQRPNATFCKPYEDWNAENYRRYVKRGSTGIALFVMNRDKPYLRYVFDVADTGVRRSSPELKPWEVTPENRSYVMEAMERTFGVAADGVLEAQLEDIASALAAEYWDDYKKQFLDIVANSFLEEYDELNIEVAFKNAVANSVSYTMYCRFVESPDNYFEHEDFQKVFDFNTRQTVNALGTAVNAISTRMFQEIEKAIGEHEQIKATERSTDYERDDLQTGRRLSDSEPSVGERGRETSGQVRQDASSIFGTEQSDASERHDSDGEPVPAPVGDRGNSESQSGVSDGAVPEGQPRTGQGNAADGVGAAHEQPESTGGGSRDDGAYQQLSLNLFLSENEQISFIDRAESFTPSAFSFAQEEIDHFLLLGSNTDEARKVVALEYMKQKPLEEIVQTLKQVYHGGYGLKEDSGNICAWYAEDGIHLAKGSSAIDSPRAQIVSWETVAERIGELLENGRFATNVELVEASGYERQKLAESLWHLYHDLSEEARSSNYLAILHQEPFRGFPDETADLAEKLDDPRFHATLVQQYSEFRKTLAENPDLLRFHYHKLNLIQKQLYELNMPLREYQTDMMQMPLVRQFITDDEVNADLTRGSGFSGGKARIYNYWQENHSAKEKMDFLKHEYGTGGHSHACSGATHSGQDHDAKGVAYTKSGCDKLQMSWAQVVQRIDGLIRKGRYLSPEEEAERQAIEEAKTDPLEDVYDRFAVIDTEDGEYAIWDNQTDDYYVDPEGVTEYFTDEWLANDYLEEVRQSVAAMESVQPEAPVAEPAEVVEASASEEPKWNYQVGDTVYLDDTAFRVEQITDREVQLRDPTLAYPIFRAENRENFERMLSQDERNHAVRVDAQTEEKPVTEDFLGKTEPRDYTPEYQLLDRLRMDCEYFLGAGQHSEKHLWAGNRHAQIAKMRELYEMIPDKPEWLTPEMINSYEERMAPRYLVAAYHHFENGFDDKLDYYTLEEAEKAAQGYVDGTMEDDGFKYDGAAVYDQQEHKCIRIYGDYPDEKAHAQVRASAEPEQQEPEHFIDHFYVAEDIQKRGALDIKEYSSFDDALRAYYALPDTQRKALGAMNTRDLPGSLDFVQCVDGKDTIIQDYAQVDGWQNAEVMDIIAQLEQSITTREIPPVPAVNFHITDDNIGEGGPKQKFARNIAAIETLFKLYFFAKSIDKLRTGGIMAFITSSGTLDKKDDRARKYIAERCDLIGAVRLPNNAFKGSGTKIMTDVIFLQKRDTLRQQDEPWLHLAEDANGITMNRYFVEHPEMICGRMEIVSGPYGPASTCQPIDPDAVDRFGKPLLETQIDTAMQHLTATLTKAEIPIQEESGEDTKYIDADPFVRNFSYTVKDDKIYYREGAVMRECNPNAASAERIRKLVELRDTTRALIDAQLQDLSDEEIHRLQGQLNRQYDAFRGKHGLINSRSAELSFRDDSSYYLLCSLENVDEKGNFISKSDMFTKRTIRSAQIPDHADTASDALALSIGERAKVDMPYMMHLTGKDEATLAKELAGVIFVEPFRKQEDGSPVYLMADEYLSGNVREKLRIAHVAADQDPAFRINVEALEQVQPKDLTAGEITVRLGVTWIGPEIIKRFADELFQSTYREQKIAVRYNEYLNNWYISNKSQGNDNIRVTNTYGTKRINGYHLLENALNLRATKIYDTIYDENGKEQHKLNGPATEEAQAKQRMIEDAFKDWIFKDRERRESLVALYNEKFNCIRPREYDGSHIQFFGMNPEIALRPHQRNAIAHILYGHNTLLAHTVGAGKTYEMVAAAMAKKRLGLCSKTLVAVPNHLTGQFASEALKLYPNANILVTTQRDFEKSNRKRFCAKIATGNYDIVVIGHSQFEKIPLSDARKAEFIRKQIDELEMQLESMDNSESRLTVKQLESKKKQLKTKLSNLLDAPKRDDVVTFEELGADSLMVDEAHNFKNLMTVTKMHNIAGISTTESQKASDLFMKCQYLDEITGARGVTFATGTPISNSMTELYTMQRYLQQYTLERNGLANFDSWAATFGETVTAIELAPEGTGYRTKTRFARFFNLPELMAMFKECADIQTADMLKLPVPALVGGKPTNIQLKPSEIQKQMVTELGERADKIRNKMVKPYEDNMLKITNDGRKLALDQRLIDPDLPDDPDSKVNICVGKIFEIWEQTMPQRSAQLVFCDLSTPKAGVFNVYDDMKAKLIERGIPETEIAFIHEANTDARKTELFGKVRSGAVRVLMGSTAKMGAGTNVQQRLVALHHLDVPWRPSDIEQREGRILRQGNENKEVYVFRYVTEGTFDAYSWQLIENKQKFIGQIMTSKSPARSCDDMDEAALSYADVLSHYQLK